MSRKDQNAEQSHFVNSTIIGIDLGTCNTCVGVWKNGHVNIVANTDGIRTTPSYIAFENTMAIVGKAAVNKQFLNKSNTFFDMKRIIGRLINDPDLIKFMQKWPFRIIDDGNGHPIAVVRSKFVYPVDITAELLKYMKDIAEKYLEATVTGAVITVPAYFNQTQRDATIEAAANAGIEVKEIISEPAAAAYAHGFHAAEKNGYKLLVFDMGAGTFDVTIVEASKGKEKFVVKGIGGDTSLGGRDFDSALCDYCELRIAQLFPHLTISEHVRHKLLVRCERAKKALSAATTERIFLSEFFAGSRDVLTITRPEFEQVCSHLVDKAIQITQKLLKEEAQKKHNPKPINRVLIVGGSTRIPLVQERLRELLGGKELDKTINPDEAVAYGATIRAAQLCEETKAQAPKICLIEATPLSLGTDSEGTIFEPMIKRNSTIPAKKSQIFYTVENDQKSMTFRVYEGERQLAAENKLLREFTLDGLPPGKVGTVAVTLRMYLDRNGILKVIANHGNQVAIANIKYGKRMAAKPVAEQVLQESQKFVKEDQEEVKRIQARGALGEAVLALRYDIDNDEHLTLEAKQQLEPIYYRFEQWLAENSDKSASLYSQKLMDFVALTSMRQSTRDTQRWKYEFLPEKKKEKRRRMGY